MSRVIRDIMTRGIKSVPGETTLAEAAKIMKDNSIRHLPVVSGPNQEIAGIISDRDIKKFVSPFAASKIGENRDKMTLNVKIEKVMVKDIITAEPQDKLKDVVEQILQKKIGCIPVVDENNRPIGIITNSNLLRELLSPPYRAIASF